MNLKIKRSARLGRFVKRLSKDSTSIAHVKKSTIQYKIGQFTELPGFVDRVRSARDASTFAGKKVADGEAETEMYQTNR